jgi:hypothetical protein
MRERERDHVFIVSILFVNLILTHCSGHGGLIVREELVNDGSTLANIVKGIEKDKEKSNICHALDLLSRCMAGLNYNQKSITEILNVCTKHHQLLLSVDTYHPTSALGYKL